MAKYKGLLAALLAAANAAGAQNLRGAKNLSPSGDGENSSNTTYVESSKSCISIRKDYCLTEGKVVSPDSSFQGRPGFLFEEDGGECSYVGIGGGVCFLNFSKCDRKDPKSTKCVELPISGITRGPAFVGFFDFPVLAVGRKVPGFHRNSYVMCTPDTNTTSSP